jgi:hypothetical protein
MFEHKRTGMVEDFELPAFLRSFALCLSGPPSRLPCVIAFMKHSSQGPALYALLSSGRLASIPLIP